MKIKNNSVKVKGMKKLKNEFAASKLSHLGDLLEYKYGISNTPSYNPEEDSFNIFIDEDYWEGHDISNLVPFAFDREELISMNVDITSHNLAKEAWDIIPALNI